MDFTKRKTMYKRNEKIVKNVCKVPNAKVV